MGRIGTIHGRSRKMNDLRNRVCPVELAGHLDSRFRRWFQNPYKILGPYLQEGMTALDIGCGPGYFSTAMAQMVGPDGHVIAADLQEGMLDKLKQKIQGSDLETRMILHHCRSDKVGIGVPVDFVLLFYMVHEVPDIEPLFREIATILKANGRVFIAEPPFHVSKKTFDRMIQTAEACELAVIEKPKLLLSKTVVLGKQL
jgi:ubiquinone/menaquinone biosynthesis C-methylase UbiE